MEIQLLVIFLPMAFAATKNFVLEYVVNCPGEENLPMIANFNVNNTANIANKIFFSGNMEVTEKIPAPIEFAYEVNRCDLKGEKCEKYSSMKLPAICKFLNNKNGLFSDVLNAVEPRLKCPIMPGKYVIEDTTLDVSNFAILPVEGWRWVTTLKGTSGEGKNKKLAVCIRIDCVMTVVKRSGK